jgi:hypothetical protein
MSWCAEMSDLALLPFNESQVIRMSLAVGLLCHIVHLVGEVTPGRRRLKRLSIGSVQRDGFFDYFAQLGKHLCLVGTVTAAKDQTRRAPHVTLIFIRPFNYFGISGTVFHFLQQFSKVITD